MSDLARELDVEMESRREELVDLCRKLVEAPSPNPPGDTRQAAAVLRTGLEDRGHPIEEIAAEASMPNLVCSIQGANAGKHLVLNGHLDTILPGDEAGWTVPVHRLTRRDDRLFGHGIGNMKGAVAAMCLAMDALAARRDRWAGRVTLTAVSDEVVLGEGGSAAVLDRDPSLLADAMLSGEGPGWMRLAVAEKGVLWLELEATCRSGQGMLVEEGRTAVVQLARAVDRIDRLNARRVEPPPELAGMGREDDALRVTANAGVLRAGRVPNQVATSAVARIDIRVPPGLPIDDVEAEVAAIVSDHEGMTWRRLRGWDANWTATDDPFVVVVRDAAAAVRAEAPALAVRLPASDASRWRRAGVPSVCYGPQPTFAAGVDDHVVEQDVVDCAKVYALAAVRFLSPEPGAR